MTAKWFRVNSIYKNDFRFLAVNQSIIAFLNRLERRRTAQFNVPNVFCGYSIPGSGFKTKLTFALHQKAQIIQSVPGPVAADIQVRAKEPAVLQFGRAQPGCAALLFQPGALQSGWRVRTMWRRPGSSGDTIPVVDPSTGASFARIARGTARDIDLAVSAGDVHAIGHRRGARSRAEEQSTHRGEGDGQVLNVEQHSRVR